MAVPTSIGKLTDKLNRQADEYQIGNLQDIRLNLKLESKPTSKIFDGEPQGDDYAFHTGSKSNKGNELQFNVGLMTQGPDSARRGDLEVRHALAVSFQGGAFSPDDVVGEMLPKVQLFNRYLRDHPKEFSDLRMWDHKNRKDWSGYRPPQPIRPSLVEKGRTIKLGRRLPPEEITCGDILRLFDRLLPVYVFAESGGDDQLARRWKSQPETFDFRPGIPERTEAARAEVSGGEMDITLRHNRLQKELFDNLSRQVGAENVGVEVPSGNGGKIDLVVRKEGPRWIFYEIKAGRSAKSCIRDAIGQLLEYSLWPGATRPEKMVVVGEQEMSSEGEQYLEKLNTRFPLPLEHKHVSPDS
jgi:hypothetical protein